MSGVEQIVLSNRKYSPDSYLHHHLAAEQSIIDAWRTILGLVAYLEFILIIVNIVKLFENCCLFEGLSCFTSCRL